MQDPVSDLRFRRLPRTGPTTGRSRDFFAAPQLLPRHADRCRSRNAPVAPASRAKTVGEVILETDRLILRRHRAADFDAYLEIFADPEMALYSGRPAADAEEAWKRLLRKIGHWSELGYGFFAIEEKATGRLVGEAGLADFRRRFGPDFDRHPEVGWAIARAFQGRGYATEAAAAALDWIERRRNVARTVCIIHRDNAASIAVAGKLGYAPFGERSYRGYKGILFERLSRFAAR